jgi:hypothetical protein
MKTLSYFTAIFLFLLACKKDPVVGPQGPQGPQGVPGKDGAGPVVLFRDWFANMMQTATNLPHN